MKNSLLLLVRSVWLAGLAGRLFQAVGCRDDSADAKRLYSSLMAGYNRLVRPVSDVDANRPFDVSIGLKLTQLSLVSVFGRILAIFFG